MAYEKGAWQFDENRATGGAATVGDQSRYCMWYIKAFISGQIGGATQGLWTCYYSSDGTIGGTGTAGDGVDNWTNSFSAAKIVRATAQGTAHSWIVMKSPQINGDYYYMLIDYVSANDYTTTVYFSKAAFTGGDYQNRPTATDEWKVGGSSGTFIINTSTYQSGRKVHGKLAPDGSFAYLTSRNATYLDSVAMFWVMSDTQPDDQYPVWTFVVGTTSNANALILVTLTSGIDAIDTNRGHVGRSYNGSGLIGNPILFPAFWTTAYQKFDTSWAAGTYDGKVPDFPALIASTQVGGGAAGNALERFKGRLADVALAATSITPLGSNDTGSEFWVVGCLWVPGSATPAF